MGITKGPKLIPGIMAKLSLSELTSNWHQPLDMQYVGRNSISKSTAKSGVPAKF